MTQSIAYPEMLRDDDYVNGVYAEVGIGAFQNPPTFGEYL